MTLIYSNNSILVTGNTGMVGSAIVRHFKFQQSQLLLTPSRKELDLQPDF
ncbi:NAD-dependent epimerase/dehydratase family protein [Pseudanabaena sp. UWO311]|nr:NAD-dependent epimerase/dehydratase family protein [Pseudanabaena sp. UWO311]TYQ26997.1 NAD-dependent epimerase/dehydratase family protein [Pseudanabaena sp. UWO311]